MLLTRSNPLATAAVVSVFQLFDQYHILSNVREMAAYLDTRLLKLLEETSLITEIRDLGLMKGIELHLCEHPNDHNECYHKLFQNIAMYPVKPFQT